MTCEIICDGKKVGTIERKDGECTTKLTREGKSMCKEICGSCC